MYLLNAHYYFGAIRKSQCMTVYMQDPGIEPGRLCPGVSAVYLNALFVLFVSTPF